MINNYPDDFSEQFFPRTYDFCEAIARTNFAKDFIFPDVGADVAADTLDKLDFFLNEYFFLRCDSEKDQQRQMHSSAQRLLAQARKALQDTVDGMAAIEGNHYATSAIFAAMRSTAGKGPSDDEIIEEFNQLVDASVKLAEITRLAFDQKNYSDGLRKFSKGAPSTTEFDRLLWRLTRAVANLIGSPYFDRREGEGRNGRTMEIAGFTSELLEAANTITSIPEFEKFTERAGTAPAPSAAFTVVGQLEAFSKPPRRDCAKGQKVIENRLPELRAMAFPGISIDNEG